MKYFNFLAAAILLCIYALGNIPPSERFNLWLVPFVIPFALLINIILILVGLAIRKKSTVFLFAALVFGGNYLFSTVGIKSLFKRSAAEEKKSFTVLSYNLGAFNTGYFPGMDGRDWQRADSLREKMISWVMENGSDIQCFEEFPYNPAYGKVDIIKSFEARGYSYYFSADEEQNEDRLFGLLIVSRYPIVGKGDVMASKNGFNRVAYADVKVGADTVRIINVHLQSMQMKPFHPGYAHDLEGGKRNFKIVLRKLKSGVFERSRQIGQLIEFLKKSPHPVICAGDFNEMPYSYSYRQLRRHLKNSFEESGRGFGFTYNGNTLNMLRIDNQFFSKGIKSVELQTLDSVKYSDHFPLRGRYLLR